MTFSCVTGQDFARSIRWARRQPISELQQKIMQRTSTHIQSVLNAVEAVAKPTAPASTPVSITQEQLVTLIEAAKLYLELRD